ncbi:MAG: hypothetical protein HN580_12110, partial [Deltaproteobacteria bacterium]|nr:hypothetical protein [Deltaproteobacteria bacterium]
DYLVEEVLALQPEPIQKFLLQTSILNRLSEALCDYITGETNSQIILDSLERTNLFIVPLDHKRQWYRYHHLFAELLQLRLHQMERDHVNELHNRASKWCQKNGLKAEAVNHAVATQDFERVARLISVYVKSSNDYDARLFEWHKLLPLEFIYKDPDLSFFNAWMLYENGQYNDAEKFLKIVEDLINSPIDPSAKIPRKTKALPPREKSEIQGKVAIIRAIIALFKGNIPDVIRLSNSAIEHLDRSDSPWWIVTSYLLGEAYRSQGEMLKAEQNYHNASDKGKRSGNYYIALIASLGVGDVRRFQGDLSGAMNIFDELFKAAQEEGFSQSPMLSILHISTGEVLGDLNKMNEALQHLQQGIDYSIQVNDAAMIGRGHLCLARIRFIKGDRSGAETIIRRMEKLSQKSDFPRYVVVLLEVLKVRIWLEKGNIKQAVQWMQNRKENRSGLTILLRESIQILFSRILFSQGKSERSLELLRQLIINAEKDGRTIRVIEMWVIRAKILFSIDDTSEATASMQKAIALAEPGGYITIFTSEGSPIADLLQVLLDEKVNISRAYVKKLLSAFQLAKLVKTDDGLVERLSERELEVLRFIAAGLSNKTITEEIHISMNTVKTHIRNIYSKLNVNSRMQATAKARELDLL